MDWAGDHVEYVVAAYAVVAVVMIGLLVHTLWRAKKLKQTLANMRLSDPGQKDV